jgi:hypothetical protein
MHFVTAMYDKFDLNNDKMWNGTEIHAIFQAAGRWSSNNIIWFAAP